MSTPTTDTTEDLQRSIAESTAAVQQAQAELDRRAAAAQAAQQAEEDAAAAALLSNAKAIEDALEQAGRAADTELTEAAATGDINRAFSGYVGYLASRTARRYHRDDLAAAATRLGQRNPYPGELREYDTTFAQWLEDRIPAAVNRRALDLLDKLGVQR